MDNYGIYTAADDNFFPGAVVLLKSLRLHGYRGQVAILDTGLDSWMRDYLATHGGTVIPLDFTRSIRYTDVRSDEHAGLRGWSFKAFGIMHARLFRHFTFIDADYIPFCNLEEQLLPRIEQGEFLSTEDGWNNWNETHAEAIGVEPGGYMNINAGFFSASFEHHEFILEEWRNLMTRRKPFDLWYGDQGALNAILDKYSVPKSLVGDKAVWNQIGLNERLAAPGMLSIESVAPPILLHQDGRRICGWHGCGWCRYWHCLGIDHFRKNDQEIECMRRNCAGKVPAAVIELFSQLLFLDGDLRRDGHLIQAA